MMQAACQHRLSQASNPLVGAGESVSGEPNRCAKATAPVTQAAR